MEDFYQLSATDIRGQLFDFDTLRGKVVLIVNTASKCGFTPQFQGLEKLYNYGVTFPMMAKVDVNGKDTHPVYQFLKSQPQGKGMLGDAIKWNFTKFLVDPHGKVVDRFAPTKAPQDLEADIKALLAQK